MCSKNAAGCKFVLQGALSSYLLSPGFHVSACAASRGCCVCEVMVFVWSLQWMWRTCRCLNRDTYRLNICSSGSGDIQSTTRHIELSMSPWTSASICTTHLPQPSHKEVWFFWWTPQRCACNNNAVLFPYFMDWNNCGSFVSGETLHAPFFINFCTICHPSQQTRLLIWQETHKNKATL